MGNFEARMEREWERADEHEAGRHLKTYSDCARCQKEVREEREADERQTPDPSWTEDAEGFVREPLSYENREGDPSLNGAFDRW